MGRYIYPDNICPRCDSPYLLGTYDEGLPAPASAVCLDCGFSSHVVDTQATLEEVNGLRKEQELEPLEKLADAGVKLVYGHLPFEWWPSLLKKAI